MRAHICADAALILISRTVFDAAFEPIIEYSVRSILSYRLSIRTVFLGCCADGMDGRQPALTRFSSRAAHVFEGEKNK